MHSTILTTFSHEFCELLCQEMKKLLQDLPGCAKMVRQNNLILKVEHIHWKSLQDIVGTPLERIGFRPFMQEFTEFLNAFVRILQPDTELKFQTAQVVKFLGIHTKWLRFDMHQMVTCLTQNILTSLI